MEPREKDAQKALRRTWITSALVCGMTPKQVSAEVGHTTPRMVLEVYDSFLDPARWPAEDERRRLAALSGFELQGKPGANAGKRRAGRRRRRKGER